MTRIRGTGYPLKEENKAKPDKKSTDLERVRKTEAKGLKGLKTELKRKFPDRLDDVCAINEVRTKSKSTPGYGVGKGMEKRTRTHFSGPGQPTYLQKPKFLY
ncbi:hypothetical protein Tco_0912878 [Tanacetum coccineum]